MANEPSPEEPTNDPFGRPHGHAVSDNLHLWIVIPGFLLIVFVGKCASERSTIADVFTKRKELIAKELVIAS